MKFPFWWPHLPISRGKLVSFREFKASDIGREEASKGAELDFF